MGLIFSMDSEEQLSRTKILALTAALLTTFYIIFSVVRSSVAERRFQKFARDNGAAEPNLFPTKLFWGLDNMYSVIQRIRRGADILDDIILPNYKLMGGWSFRGIGLGGQVIVHTAEPKNMQAILATNFNDYSIGTLRQKQFEIILGKGIFNADGAAWSHARALFRPIFVRDAINDLDETERASKILVDALPAGSSGWTEKVDLMPLFYRFTLDTATAFIFGESVESQTAALDTNATGGKREEFAKFTESFSVIQDYAAWRMRLQSLYWLADGPKLRAANGAIRKFANRIINKTLNGHVGPDNKYGQPEKYSIVEELTKATQDPLEIRDNVISLLAAGRDTTSALLSWIFYLLAVHPDVYAKLRQIIVQDFGENSLKNPTFAELKSCRYLQYVISETLRLYPTVPGNIKHAIKDTILPVGGGPDGTQPLAVKKGSIIAMMVYLMHRRPDIWGEDADQFRPERWGDVKRDWSFIPFSGGPRICLGRKFNTLLTRSELDANNYL
jgi:cytochrome P450